MLDSHERLRSTLAHEMCHAAQWVLDGASKVSVMIWVRVRVGVRGRGRGRVPRHTVVLDGASTVLTSTLTLTLNLTLTLTLPRAAVPLNPTPTPTPTPEQPPHGPHFRRWADRFERAVPGMLGLGLALGLGLG